MILDHGDVASIEHHVRELTDHAVETARERAACETAVRTAASELESAQAELPLAERNAKEHRQAQNDAIRGRAELEQRLAELVEAEDLTRARRQQAEQRAQGFRAAAAFASTGRAEAEAAGDRERAERERLVEDRAAREAANAEARATEELSEETKIGRHRAEIEAHVEAERALESTIAADRASAEARALDLREIVERAAFRLHEGQVNLARLDADCERIAGERAAAGDQLREIGSRARTSIQGRIAELRESEAALATERAEQERLLAALTESERRIEPEPVAPRAPEPEPRAAHVDVDEDDDDASAFAHASSNGVHPAAHDDGIHLAGASADSAEHAEHIERDEHAERIERAEAAQATTSHATSDGTPEAPHAATPDATGNGAAPHFSTVTFTASPNQPRDRQSTPAVTDAPDDERGPGFRSIIGNIFTRRKVEEPIVDEGPSIADRIARDFGLLGGEEDDDATPDAPAHLALDQRTADAHPADGEAPETAATGTNG